MVCWQFHPGKLEKYKSNILVTEKDLDLRCQEKSFKLDEKEKSPR